MNNKSRDWLVNIRQSYGFTQENIADKVEIKRAYYSQIEIGTRNPSVNVAKRIADALGFDWTLFFEDGCSETQHIKQKSTA